ncbi:MAG: histidine phosphatase family protein [Paracoccaceae bacterium]
MTHDLLVIRHGETEWNREGRLQGALDSPLTGRGMRQADALGCLLLRLGVGPGTHAALSSPQGRAWQTALRVLGPCGLAPRPDARLREIGVGDWAGLTRGTIGARWPGADDADEIDFYGSAPGGEGFEAVAARVAPLLGALTGPTVLVTHGMTGQALRVLAMGWGLDRMWDLPKGQGVAFRIRDGRHDVLDPDDPPV